MKSILIKLTLFLLLFVIPASTVHADVVTVTASLDRNQISQEDQVLLTLSVAGAGSSAVLQMPNLPDFDVASNGKSARVSIINGTMSSQTDYSFVLQPRKAGELTIGPATVNYQGKIYQSKPIAVHVMKGAAPEREKEGKDLFITTEVDHANPYVGEQIMFRLKFYRRINVANASLGELAFEGFQAEDAGKETTYTSIVDGVSYQVTEIRKLLIPGHAGAIIIPAAVLQCQVPVERQQRTPGQPFGDDFFGFGIQRTTNKVVRSRPLTVHVRSLPPEGKPPAFSGVVGSFQLSAEFDKKEVRKGDSATLTMKITGKGDLTAAPRPDIRGIEQFKAYDDQPVSSRKIVEGRMISEKIFKKALVPLNAGDFRVPEVSFWYFDPDSGKYVKASAAIPGLHVLPADERDKSLVVEGPGSSPLKQNVQIVGKDILPIDTDIHALGNDVFRPLSPLMLASLLAPPFLFLGALAYKTFRDRRAMDIGFSRSTKAMKQARKGMAEALARAKRPDQKMFCAGLSRTVKTYLGDKLNRSGEAMTPGELIEALQSRRGPDVLVKRTAALLDALERGQFAREAFEPAASGKLVQDAQDLIQQWEKRL